MSTSAYAHIIVGLKIKRSKVMTTKIVRCCKHKKDDSKFCPECGEPMWKEESFINPAVADLEDSYDSDPMDITYTTADDWSDDPTFYIGRSYCHGNWHEYKDISLSSKVFELESVKQKIEDRVGKVLGQGEFGIWLFASQG